MQTSLAVKYGKIKERYSNYSRWHSPAQIFATIGVILPFGLLITIGADGQPQAFEVRVIAGVIFGVLIAIAAYFRKLSRKYLTPHEDVLFMTAFELVSHLKYYSVNELDSEKNQARIALDELISHFDSKWAIITKSNDDLLTDFDIIMSSLVKLVLSLKNAYMPVLEKGTKDEIVATIPFFEKIVSMTNAPSESLVHDVIESALPVQYSEKETKKPSIASSRSVVKHGIIISILAVVSGVICYLVLSPIATGQTLSVVQTSLEAAGVVSGIYFGLTVFLAKKQQS